MLVGFIGLLACSVIFDHAAMTQTSSSESSSLPTQTEEIHARLAQSNFDGRALLNMTLCHDKCEEDCKTYVTPVGQCFSSGSLFPNDPSWSDGWDVFDEMIQSSTLHRTIFHTQNNTCGGEDPTDSFEIPLGVCVGPFGRPRPWGIFQLIEAPSPISS